jgi:putative transposase
MPWKAITMTQQRQEFVRRALAKNANLSALCREFGITRKTGRQWRERARRGGIAALSECSRRPLHSPKRLGEEEVCRLVLLKSAWPHWGPKKLCLIYQEKWGCALSVSTCHRVLKGCGLVQVRRQRVRQAVRESIAAKVAREPNDVWTVDFKGWWRLGDGRRCEPLTVRDAYSRFVLAAVVPAAGRTEQVAEQFRRLFQQYGLPKVIKSDNGTPFASANAPLGLSKLSAEWVALGIELERSRPGHPQDNGAHERLHRDIEAEVAAHVQVDLAAQQAALDVWCHDHNHIRPHDYLQGRRPAQIYRKSTRRYERGPVALEYGPGYQPRLVSCCGLIRYRSQQIFLTNAISGWHVGLRLLEADLLEVWFSYLRLGTIDLKTNRFDSAPSRSVKAVSLAA